MLGLSSHQQMARPHGQLGPSIGLTNLFAQNKTFAHPSKRNLRVSFFRTAIFPTRWLSPSPGFVCEHFAKYSLTFYLTLAPLVGDGSNAKQPRNIDPNPESPHVRPRYRCGCFGELEGGGRPMVIQDGLAGVICANTARSGCRCCTCVQPLHSYCTVTAQLLHSYCTVTAQLLHGETYAKSTILLLC